MNPWIAGGIGLFGNFLHALGMVLMKKYVGFWSSKARSHPHYLRKGIGWSAGFVLINAHPVFSYFALIGLPPNVVAAMIGTSVAFSTILAAILLKERLFARRVVGILIMFASVAVVGFRSAAQTTQVDHDPLFAFILPPLVATVLIVLFKRKVGFKAFPTVIAVVAGACGGSMVLAMRALQIETGGAVASWPASPWFWLFYASGIASTLLIQLAFRRGDVSEISPADYAMQVLWPTLAAHFVFYLPVDPLQSTCILGILLALSLIAGPPRGLARHAAPATGAAPPD